MTDQKDSRTVRGGWRGRVRLLCSSESGAVTADMLGVVAVSMTLSLSALSAVSSAIHGSAGDVSGSIMAISGDAAPDGGGTGSGGASGGDEAGGTQDNGGGEDSGSYGGGDTGTYDHGSDGGDHGSDGGDSCGDEGDGNADGGDCIDGGDDGGDHGSDGSGQDH
ncbi:MAG: hypothetical protein Q8O82_19325 [Pseudorhodobacter sp.]|nr:hypothetical protein [Pseudorhodobacter sp.]